MENSLSCNLFGVCGGCSYLNIPYEQQLAQKEKIISDLLSPFYNGQFEPIIPSPQITYYRNKMEYAFGRDRIKNFALGLRERGSFYKFVDVKNCLLLSEKSNLYLEYARNWALENKLSIYSPLSKMGELRYFVIRKGKKTGECLILFITKPDLDRKLVMSLADGLKEKYPEITTFIWGVNSDKGDVARVESSEILWGSGFIYDKIGEIKFKISPSSFFQTNTYATEKLYTVIKNLLVSCSSKERKVLDFYCGNGGITLFVADVCKEIFGVEINPDAVKDAVENAERNNIKNVKFLCAVMEKELPLMSKEISDSIAIIDPPRAGLHPKTVKALMEFKFPELIYVSCNPKKLAEDMVTLGTIYDITFVQPLDLFPHTPHMETVVLLKRK